ncbi:MAG: hypothetical protein JWM07_620, partial [Candidatus Saccharibacteria bacterium]|nr:hypothetical protein [Candidatus Saccharibacteria bacterium]
LEYNFLKLSYELRSAIVHSNDTLRRKIHKKLKEEYGFNLYEANAELIKMNRFILKLFLDDPGILAKLDDVILSGGYDGEQYKNMHMKQKIKARARTFRNLERKARSERLALKAANES